jgi:hypothetical protein
MAVPPSAGRDVHPPFESDFRDEPAPRVPKPLPDRGRPRTTAAATVAVTLLVIALIVLL